MSMIPDWLTDPNDREAGITKQAYEDGLNRVRRRRTSVPTATPMPTPPPSGGITKQAYEDGLNRVRSRRATANIAPTAMPNVPLDEGFGPPSTPGAGPSILQDRQKFLDSLRFENVFAPDSPALTGGPGKQFTTRNIPKERLQDLFTRAEPGTILSRGPELQAIETGLDVLNLGFAMPLQYFAEEHVAPRPYREIPTGRSWSENIARMEERPWWEELIFTGMIDPTVVLGPGAIPAAGRLATKAIRPAVRGIQRGVREAQEAVPLLRGVEKALAAPTGPGQLPQPIRQPAPSPTAPSPGRVREIANKWQAAKARNSVNATKDLNTLREEGYLVDDASEALTEYKDTIRGDFDDAEDFSEARTEAWDKFIEALDNVELEDIDLATRATLRAAPSPVTALPDTGAVVPEVPVVPAGATRTGAEAIQGAVRETGEGSASALQQAQDDFVATSSSLERPSQRSETSKLSLFSASKDKLDWASELFNGRQTANAVENTPPGTAPRVNGAPTGEIRPRSVGDSLPEGAGGAARQGARQSTEALAQSELDSLRYEAVQDSSLDKAASSFWYDGDINKYNSSFPPGGGDDVAESFLNAPFSEISLKNSMSLDPTRLTQTIDGGVFNSAAQNSILWPIHRTFQASMRYGVDRRIIIQEGIDTYGMHDFNAKKFRKSSGNVIEHIGSNDLDVPIATLMDRPAIKSLISRYSPKDQARIVGFAQFSRRVFDDLLAEQNMNRVRRGQKPIETITNYRPWVLKTNLWSKLGFKKSLPDSVGEGQSIFQHDFIPDEAFNPRAEARTGGLANYDKETDLVTLLDDYVNTSTRDIFFTDIIRNGTAHTKVLRSKGLNGAADSIDSWVLESFAGKKTALTEALAASPIPTPVIKGSLLLARSLNRAVFPMNYSWNTIIQTSSAIPTIARYGPRNGLKGMDYIFNKSARQWTRSNAYASIIKQARAGRISSQGLNYANSATIGQSLNKSPLDTAQDIGNFLANVIEDNLTGISIRAAYHDGIEKGLTGRALTEWASEGGSKTQSLYNMHDRPGWLRSPEVSAGFPYSGFAFEMMNNIREMFLPVGRVGAYKSVATKRSQRLRQLLYFIGGAVVVNMYGDALIDRKPWVVGSFMPFYSAITGSLSAGSPRGTFLPGQYSYDFYKGFTDIVEHGDWGRMRRWSLRYHMYGGTQISRTMEGLIALYEGQVDDVSGKELYKVDSSSVRDWLSAITSGPIGTEGGREYRARGDAEGGRGWLEDVIGFDLPAKKEEEFKYSPSLY